MTWHGGGGLGGHSGGAGGYGRLGDVTLDDEILGAAFDRKVVSRFIPYLKPYREWLILSFISMIVYTLTMIAPPYIIGLGIKAIIDGNGSALKLLGLLFAANAAVNWAANYTQIYFMAKVGVNTLYDLRTKMFAHLQRQSASFYDRSESGRIMSRVQNDVLQLQQFSDLAITALADAFMLVGIIGFMMLMNVKLAVITLSVIPVFLAIMIVWQSYARQAFIQVRIAISSVNAGLQENISGVRVTQSMNREDINMEQFDRLNYDHLDANLRAGQLSAGLMPVVEILTVVSMGLVVIFGGFMVFNGELGVAFLVSFFLYVQRFFEPVRALTMQYTQFQRAMASGTRIFELLDVKPDLVDDPDAVDMPPIEGRISYQRVSFHYAPGVPVLRDINLEIKPGQTVALVGPTGAGKTTFVSLMERLYDVTEGKILIDGHDVRDVTRRSLAGQMSVVLQEPFLYSTTVKENIRYCHEDITDEDVVRAAKAVGAHDFIMRLQKSYDTVLQERGMYLSLGQRQLISFARAVVSDPRIIILDEATANIDTRTERLIQEALKTLLKDRTSLVIAHRLSTIIGADMVVVLDHGRIVETGTHAELLAKKGLYASLYDLSYQQEGLIPNRTASSAPSMRGAKQ